MRPKRVICSAPSGAGKTTLLRGARQALPALRFSISATTRAPRPQEREGEHYYFFSVPQFQAGIDAGAFVEWEEVYPGTFYGTLHAELARIEAQGGVPLFEVDVKGGLSLKRKFGDDALAIFLAPPDIPTLEARLIARDTETPEQIARRVDKAAWELSFQDRFDVVIVNRDLATAQAELNRTIEAFLAA